MIEIETAVHWERPFPLSPSEGLKNLNDLLLHLLKGVADNSNQPAAKAILFCGGAAIIGMIAPNKAVSEDIWTGLNLDEAAAREFARAQETIDQANENDDVLSLSDAQVFVGSTVHYVPFLRVSVSAIDAWWTGAQGQIKHVEDIFYPPNQRRQ